MPAVSLPFGATSLPSTILPYFSRFTKIYLWMDADLAGKNGAETFAKKLGVDRVFVVNSRANDPNGPKDANDCLKMGVSLTDIMKTAKKLAGDNIIQIKDISSDIVQFLNRYDTFSGFKSTCFNFYNKKVKGLRMGELTVLSGETGSGKTTFLTQLSLDFMQQGVSTLWGSFEIKNDKIGSIFMIQNAKKNLRHASIEELKYHVEEIEKLPLYLLNFHGSSSISDVTNSIEYSISQYGIQNIVLDNLQFMVGCQAKSMNKFDFQDEIIQTLRRIATEKNVHIMLVIHPKKTDEFLKISSIFGSAKATQEADNVWMISNYKGLRILEIAKNRFDGTCGKIVLAFNKLTNRFFEITEKEFKEYVDKNMKVDDLIQKRIEQFGRVEIGEELGSTREVETGDLNQKVMQKLQKEVYMKQEAETNKIKSNLQEKKQETDFFDTEEKDFEEIIEREQKAEMEQKAANIRKEKEQNEKQTDLELQETLGTFKTAEVSKKTNIFTPKGNDFIMEKLQIEADVEIGAIQREDFKSWLEEPSFKTIEQNLDGILSTLKTLDTFHSPASFEKTQNLAGFMYYKDDEKRQNKKKTELYSGMDFL